MRRMIVLFAALVFAVAAVCSGCQSASAQASPAAAFSDAGSDSATPGSISSAVSQAALRSAPRIASTRDNYTAAVNLVSKQYDGALPLQCSADTINGAPVWDVDILTDNGLIYETEVNAPGTTIWRTARDEDDTAQVNASEVEVDYNTAIRTAMRSESGSTFEDFELERDSAGNVVYDIGLRGRHNQDVNIVVDAQTGEICRDAGVLEPVWDHIPVDELYENDNEDESTTDVFSELFGE